MAKYLQVFKISFQEEFAYRVNFIMWRVRNIFQIFLVFFLWDAVFSDPSRSLFGYDRSKILTYIFGLILVKAFVLSSKSMGTAGEVSRGDLNNYLVKPVSYFKYWLTRDLSSKLLNIVFAVAESVLLYFVLKPPFFLQTNPVTLFAFLISIIFAMLIFFNLVFLTSSVPFWVPEAAWGVHFVVTIVVIEFLSGALFPLDVLPNAIQSLINYTPFPYMIFFPLQIYLGKISGFDAFKGIFISGIWVFFLWFVMKSVWKKGLKVYQAYGR